MATDETTGERRPRNRTFEVLDRHFPFWAPQLVVLIAIVLDVFLPRKVTLLPRWVLPVCEGVLLIGLMAASPHPRWRHSTLRRRIALGLIGLVSATNIFSLVLLVIVLINGTHAAGKPLIGAGAVLWLTNILLFGLWYWELDRGGPIARANAEADVPDFLFPQMADPKWAPRDWKPGLVDYLYVSFTNAAAFSPTDTMPLTSMAKSLMTAQSVTALVTVGLVVARAVNILAA